MKQSGRSAGRVLFVGNEASRTGSPIMLLNLLRWLRQHSDIDFDLLLRDGGPLIEDYERVCTVFVAGSPSRVSRIGSRIKARLTVSPRPWLHGPLLAGLARRSIRLIYANTVTNGDLLTWLAPLGCPVVCHVHEVDSHFRSFPTKVLNRLSRDASHHIALTEPMADSLVRSGVPRTQITLVPGFLPLASPREQDSGNRRNFRNQHDIPEDAILVGGCGRIHWQKGPDLLVRVASSFARKPSSRRLHFVWVGGTSGEENFEQLRRDIQAANLAGHFSVIPSLADTAPYMSSLDIFALTSRDDPSPLVALEAGALGVPVVCFAGNAIMVDNRSGRVVPYLDLNGFVGAIRELAADDRLRAELGQRLAETVWTRHDISVAMPKIVDLIRAFVDADPGKLADNVSSLRLQSNKPDRG